MGSRIQEWPARSPNLTPLDFYLSDYIKSQVFRATDYRECERPYQRSMQMG